MHAIAHWFRLDHWLSGNEMNFQHFACAYIVTPKRTASCSAQPLKIVHPSSEVSPFGPVEHGKCLCFIQLNWKK